VTNDRAVMYAALRDSTAAMLGKDPANLTALEKLKIDLAASLRLEVDKIVAAQLNGDEVDMRRMTTAADSLRSLFPAPVSDDGHDFAGAAEELDALLHRRHDAIDQRRADVLRQLAGIAIDASDIAVAHEIIVDELSTEPTTPEPGSSR
jgi:hypothetical protein